MENISIYGHNSSIFVRTIRHVGRFKSTARVESGSESPISRVRVESQVLQISDSSRTRVESQVLQISDSTRVESQVLQISDSSRTRVESQVLQISDSTRVESQVLQINDSSRTRVESQVLQISDSSRTRVESLRLESTSPRPPTAAVRLVVGRHPVAGAGTPEDAPSMHRVPRGAVQPAHPPHPHRPVRAAPVGVATEMGTMKTMTDDGT